MRGIEERPAGFLYQGEFLHTAEECVLLEQQFRGLRLHPVVMYGVASRREIRHFGVGYDFDSWTTGAAEPIPPYLLELRDRVAVMAQVEATGLAEALVTRYPPGAGIGWHRDASAFGRVVIGVSLGSDALMRFQPRAAGGERRVFEQPLARRSAYVLAGAARFAWEHSVLPVSQERWSVTFRQLRRSAVGE